MPFIIILLSIILIIVLKNSISAKKDFTKKTEEYENSVKLLQKQLDETSKKLNFYKNIEQDSGNLNSESQNTNFSTQEKSCTCNEIFPSLDEEQKFALNAIENTNYNLFITGKAGTGKSFLLNYFRKTTFKKHIVLAPTGISALNIDGSTLHSVFGYYNLVNLNLENITLDKLRLKSEKILLLKHVSTIVIDEISMVRADTFDKIDKILKVINENNLPFGGKQIIIFGDLFQLPPIVKREENKFLIDKYGGIYFFNSISYKNSDFKFIELTINHRQENDFEFFALLNRIREGCITEKDIADLNMRVIENESAYDRFTTLLPTKAEVESINKNHISQLDSKLYTYRAQIVFDKYPNENHNIEAIFPILNKLELKCGTLVMMTYNDPEKRWVNGTLGIINKLYNDSIFVSINGYTYEIHPTEFTEQEITYSEGVIKYEDSLKVYQYPIVPAYAITIHKSQGQTFNNIVCDIDRCFANGQAYVALSRCTSLNGLHLKNAINRSSIRVDKDILDFYNSQTKLT